MVIGTRYNHNERQRKLIAKSCMAKNNNLIKLYAYYTVIRVLALYHVEQLHTLDIVYLFIFWFHTGRAKRY